MCKAITHWIVGHVSMPHTQSQNFDAFVFKKSGICASLGACRLEAQSKVQDKTQCVMYHAQCYALSPCRSETIVLEGAPSFTINGFPRVVAVEKNHVETPERWHRRSAMMCSFFVALKKLRLAVKRRWMLSGASAGFFLPSPFLLPRFVGISF